MRRALAVLAATVATAAPAAAQTAEEIVARSIEARGGLASIKAVKAVRMIGRIKMGTEEMPILVEIKRGAGFRTEITLPEGRAIQGFDGRTAWGIPPGSTTPEALPAEAATQMTQQADLEGAFVDYKAKGHRIELVGTEKGAAGLLYRLRVRLADGDVDDYLVDGTSWLPVRVESKRLMRGRTVEGESRLGRYEEAGGWKWPRLIENSAQGLPERQSVRFEEIVVNPSLEDSRFRLPAVGSPGNRSRPDR